MKKRVWGIPKEDVKLKEGTRNVADSWRQQVNVSHSFVPCPFQSGTCFNSLFSHPDFKNYVHENFDSIALISSILENVEDESSVLDNVTFYQKMYSRREALHDEIIKFQRFPLAGIAVCLGDNLKSCRQDLLFRQGLPCLPHVHGFQLRLAAMRSLASLSSNDRDIPSSNSVCVFTSTDNLSYCDHPQLSIMCPLMQSGLILLQIVSTTDMASSEGIMNNVILDSFEKLCKSLYENNNLALYSTWSPRPQYSMKELDLTNATVYGSSGSRPECALKVAHQNFHKRSATSILSANEAIGWTPDSGTKSTFWAVKLKRADTVVAVGVSWINPSKESLSSLDVSAPKVVHILARSEVGSPFFSVVRIDVEKENMLQKSWHHVYHLPCDQHDLKHVVEVKLQLLNGPCHSNKNGKLTVYNFELFGRNIDANFVDIMSLTREIQTSLFKVKDTAGQRVEHEAQLAYISVPRVTGSLGLTLHLLQQLWYTDKWECDMSSVSSALTESMESLICAIYKREMIVRDEIETILRETSADKNIIFDSFRRSSGISLLENGVVAESLDGKSNYVMLSCVMDFGEWEWAIALEKENFSDETCCLGIAKCPLRNWNYETSKDMWLVRCYNGERYNCGRQHRTVSIPAIHCHDHCFFKYNVEMKTLSLRVNEKDYGVIFENIAIGGVSPVVSFYGSRKSVRLLHCKHHYNPYFSRRCGGNKYASALPPPRANKSNLRHKLEETPMSHSRSLLNTFSVLILQSLDDLVKVQAHEAFIRSQLPSLHWFAKPNANEYPFCVEISGEVLSALQNSIRFFLRSFENLDGSAVPDHNISNKMTLIVHLVEIMKAHFYFISKMSSRIAMLFGRIGSKEFVDIFAPLLNVLVELINFSPLDMGIDGFKKSAVLGKELNMCAAEAFGLGIPFLLPKVTDKVCWALHFVNFLFPSSLSGKIIINISDDWNSPMSHFQGGASTSIMFVILKELLIALSHKEEIRKLLVYLKESSICCSSSASESGNGGMDLILQLIRLRAEIDSTYLGLSFSSENMSDDCRVCFTDSEFQKLLKMLLASFQDLLIDEIIKNGSVNQSEASESRVDTTSNGLCDVFTMYVKSLCFFCELYVNLTLERNVYETKQKWIDTQFEWNSTIADSCHRKSILCSNFVPALHAICLTSDVNCFLPEVLPFFIRLYRVMLKVVDSSGVCKVTKRLLYNLSEYNLNQHHQFSHNCNGASSGWHNVKASFEKISDASFTLSDGRTVFSANDSGRTSVAVQIDGLSFASSRYASTPEIGNITKLSCHFLLEDDVASHEASLFGVSMLPLQRRDYTESSQLLMYHSGMGVFYRQGRTLPSTLEKKTYSIHPGDSVRLEIDLERHSVSYSINGSPYQVAFKDIPSRPLLPACGSSRANVRIRLVGVQVWGIEQQFNDFHGERWCEVTTKARLLNASTPQQQFNISWIKNNDIFCQNDPSILAFSANACKNIQYYYRRNCLSWLTARGNHGVSCGVHEWSFHILENARKDQALRENEAGVSLMAFGIVLGGRNICSTQQLAGKTSRVKELHLCNNVKPMTSFGESGKVAYNDDVNPNVNVLQPPRKHTRQQRFSMSDMECDDFMSGMQLGDESDDQDIDNAKEMHAETRSEDAPPPPTKPSLSRQSTPRGIVVPQQNSIFSFEVDDDDIDHPTANESHLRRRASLCLVGGCPGGNDLSLDMPLPDSTAPTSLPVLSRTSTPSGIPVQSKATMFNFDFEDDDLDDFCDIPSNLSPPNCNSICHSLPPSSALSVRESSPPRRNTESRNQEALEHCLPKVHGIASNCGSRSSSVNELGSRTSSRSSIFDDDSSPHKPRSADQHQALLHSSAQFLLEADDNSEEDHVNGDWDESNVSPDATAMDPTECSLSWCSDGSLWFNGIREKENFGLSFLPLSKLNIVSIRINFLDQTVSYHVDGKLVGIALGPPSSGAAIDFSASSTPIFFLQNEIQKCMEVYPAASISSIGQAIKLVPSGSVGSIVVPYALFLEQCMTSSLSRISASLIGGDTICATVGPTSDDMSVDSEVSNWVKSSLFEGGFDPYFKRLIVEQNLMGEILKNYSPRTSDWKYACERANLDPMCQLTTRVAPVLSKVSKCTCFLEEFVDSERNTEPNGATVFMHWMNTTVDQVVGADPPTLRNMLQKNYSYSFDRLEYLLVACLLKHLGLVEHAIDIQSRILLAKQNNETVPPSNSSMQELWKAVKALRRVLRQDLQAARISDLDQGRSSLTSQQYAEISLDDKIDEGLDENKLIIWTKQSEDTNILKNCAAYRFFAIVRAVGFDTIRRHVVVIVDVSILLDSVVTELKLHQYEDMIKPPSCLWINGALVMQATSSFQPLVPHQTGSATEMSSSGYIIFDCSDIISSQITAEYASSTDISFQFGGQTDGYEVIVLHVNLEILTGISHTELSRQLRNNSKSFSRVYDALRRRCMMLLLMKPTTRGTSVDGDILNSFQNEILSQCLSFVLTDCKDAFETEIFLSDIARAIANQDEACQRRRFGIEALMSLLSTPLVHANPVIIEELTLFVGPAMSFAHSDKKCGANEFNCHCSFELKGCYAESMSLLQETFWNFYKLLGFVMSSYLFNWQQKNSTINSEQGKVDIVVLDNDIPSHIIVRALLAIARTSCVYLKYNSDFVNVLSSSMLLQLKTCISFEIYERYVRQWMIAAQSLAEFVKVNRSRADEFENLFQYLVEWKPFRSSFVRNGLASQDISCREILLHLYLRPRGLLTELEEKALGLDWSDSYEHLCRTVDMSKLSLLYEKFLSILRRNREKKREEVAKAEIDRALRIQELEERELLKLKEASVPLFDASAICKGGLLSSCQQVFHIPTKDLPNKSLRKASISRVGACLGEVEYDLSKPSNIYDTGNYFEITILNIGVKDIGVGLAVASKFPLVGEMPGWGAHSYGYHGDDGRKFGDCSTPGVWPTWMEGDVIGCGVKVESRDVFFTRNGALLGVAFRHVTESLLRPVVAFHSPHTDQKVMINFGKSNFLYKGSEIVVHPAALAERKRLLCVDTAMDGETVGNATSVISKCGDISIENDDEKDYRKQDKEGNTENESKEDNVNEKGQCLQVQSNDDADLHLVKRFYHLREELDTSTEQLNELCQLRNLSWSILRYFVTTASDTSDHGQNEHAQELQRNCMEYFLRELRIGAKYISYIRDNHINKMDDSILGTCLFDQNKALFPLLAMCPAPVPSASAAVLGFSSLREMDEIEVLQQGRVDSSLYPFFVDPWIEASEVEYFVGKHLFGFACLLPHVNFTQFLTGDCRSAVLNVRTLLILSRIGSIRTRRLAYCINEKYLPQCPPYILNDAISSLVSGDKQTDCADQGTFFDVVASSLRTTIIASEGISLIENNCKRSRLHPKFMMPVEFGTYELHFADLDTAILRGMLSSTMWREVLLTRSRLWLNDAITVLKSVLTFKAPQPLSMADMNVLETASTVCSILSGLGSFYPGATVKRDTTKHMSEIENKSGDEEVGWVVSEHSRSHVNTIFGHQYSNNSSDIELVGKDSLKISITSIFIGDDEGRSQMLELLLELMGECLTLFLQNCQCVDKVHTVGSLLNHLTASVTAACSHEIEGLCKGDEISGRDSELLCKFRELVHDIALLPVPNTYKVFNSLSSLNVVDVFCKGRVFEWAHACKKWDDGHTLTENDVKSSAVVESDTSSIGQEKEDLIVDFRKICSLSKGRCDDVMFDQNIKGDVDQNLMHFESFFTTDRNIDLSTYSYASFRDSSALRFAEYDLTSARSATVDVTSCDDASYYLFPATLTPLLEDDRRSLSTELPQLMINENNKAGVEIGPILCYNEDVKSFENLENDTIDMVGERLGNMIRFDAGSFEGNDGVQSQDPFVISSFSDNNLGVSLYHHVPVANTRLVTKLFHDPFNFSSLQDWKTTINRTWTILLCRKICEMLLFWQGRNSSSLFFSALPGIDDKKSVSHSYCEKSLMLLKLLFRVSLNCHVSKHTSHEGKCGGLECLASISENLSLLCEKPSDFYVLVLNDIRANIHSLTESSIQWFCLTTLLTDKSYPSQIDISSDQMHCRVENDESSGSNPIQKVIGEVQFSATQQQDPLYLIEFDHQSKFLSDGIMSLDVNLIGKESTPRIRFGGRDDGMPGYVHYKALRPIVFTGASGVFYQFTRKKNDNCKWDCRFRIRQLPQYLQCVVQREFELVLRVQLDEGTYNENFFSKNSDSESRGTLYFWRPKRVDGYRNMGDVITTSFQPPVGALLIRNTSCKPIKKFWRVFTNMKYGYSIWRPIPPQDYVSMGDVVSLGKDTKPTSTACGVPAWAIEECGLGNWVLSSKKSTGHALTANVWAIQSRLGHFMGGVDAETKIKMLEALNRVSRKYATASKSNYVPLCSTMGGYKLRNDYLQVVSGEWKSEADVITNIPSLQWTESALLIIIDIAEKGNNAVPSNAFCDHLLQSDLLGLLYRHLTSVRAANNVKFLPVIVRLLRLYKCNRLDTLIPPHLIIRLCALCTSIHMTVCRLLTSQPPVRLTSSIIDLMELVAEIGRIKPSGPLLTEQVLMKDNVTDSINLISNDNCGEFVLPLSAIESALRNRSLIHTNITNQSQITNGQLSCLAEKQRLVFQEVVELYEMLHKINDFEAGGCPKNAAPILPPTCTVDTWFKNMTCTCYEESVHPYLTPGDMKKDLLSKGFSFRQEILASSLNEKVAVSNRAVFSKTLMFSFAAEVRIHVDSRSSLRSGDFLKVTPLTSGLCSGLDIVNSGFTMTGADCGKVFCEKSPIILISAGVDRLQKYTENSTCVSEKRPDCNVTDKDNIGLESPCSCGEFGLQVEFSMCISDGDHLNDDWGWAFAVFAKCEPHLKLEKRLTATGGVQDIMQKLEIKVNVESEMPQPVEVAIDEYAIATVRNPCNDIDIFSLYSTLSEQISVAEVKHMKKVFINRFKPQRKFRCLIDESCHTDLNIFDMSYLAEVLELISVNGCLLATERCSVKSDKMSLNLECPSGNAGPDLLDVLCTLSKNFSWYSTETLNSSKSPPRSDLLLLLKELQGMDFYVLHIQYFKKDGEKMDMYLQAPHLCYCVVRSDNALTFSRQPVKDLFKTVLDCSECVCYLYAIHGSRIFYEMNDNLQRNCVLYPNGPNFREKSKTSRSEISTWWNELSFYTNPVVVASLLLLAPEDIVCLDTDDCVIKERLNNEEYEAYESYHIFAALTRGLYLLKAESSERGFGIEKLPSLTSNFSICVKFEGVFEKAGTTFEHFCCKAINAGHVTPKQLHDAMLRWNQSMMRREKFFSLDFALVEALNLYLANLPSDKSRTDFLDAPLTVGIHIVPSSSTVRRDFSAVVLSAEVFKAWSLIDIQKRISVLASLNRSVFRSVISLVDITTTCIKSLGGLIREYKYYLFTFLKKELLSEALAKTSSNNNKNSNPGYKSTTKGLPAYIRLDNLLASQSKASEDANIHLSKNCFVQAFQQLHEKDDKIYRFIFSKDRVFHIQFESENGIDAGGVFREGVTRIIEDLFNISDFELFVTTPNGDKFLPDPRLFDDPLAMKMLDFVGKLMGMSLRAKLTLPFSFPSIVWKTFTKESYNIRDLEEIDTSAAHFISQLSDLVNPASSDIDEKKRMFDEKYGERSDLYFTFVDNFGDGGELIPNGNNVKVEFCNAKTYCDALLKKHFSQYKKGIEAMAGGMYNVVPQRGFCLFSWQDLEVLVSGEPIFNIPLWKANTETMSSLSSHVVDLFWEVLENLSGKEKEGFVRFAWGRSRLPNSAKEFTVKMKLGPATHRDAKLPIAHTCFFQIELPNYRTVDEMRHGLLTAINFGGSGILLG